MAELAHTAVAARTPGAVADGGGVIVDRPGLRVTVAASLAQVRVAVHPGSLAEAGAFLQAVAETLGAPLPETPNTSSGDPGRCAFWLAPARWLLVADGAGAIDTTAWRQAPGAAGVAANVADAGDALFVVDIGGRRAGQLVAMACSLDLESGTLADGRCAQAPFAGLHALLYRRADGFRVHVDATLAPHLAGWLRQSALLLG